jgi:hypothetical protein
MLSHTYQPAYMLIYAPSRRDLVAKLIEENQDVWKELINNKFCRAMKESTRGDNHVLRGFEWYMMVCQISGCIASILD